MALDTYDPNDPNSQVTDYPLEDELGKDDMGKILAAIQMANLRTGSNSYHPNATGQPPTSGGGFNFWHLLKQLFTRASAPAASSAASNVANAASGIEAASYAGGAGAAGAGAGAGAAGAAGSSTLPLVLSGVQGAAGGIEAARVAKRNAQIQQQGNAIDESKLDPFRTQVHQAEDIGRLDMLANASYSPVTVTPPARYADKVPTITGGSSYTPSPASRQAAGALQESVMGGQAAPTMLDPTNYGKNNGIDLLKLLAARRANPTTPVTTNAMAPSYAQTVARGGSRRR